MKLFNLNPKEVAKFDDMATHWWDPLGPCKPLHLLNPVRLAFINARVPLANKQVLDLGCGGGLLSEAMAQQGAQVSGLDASTLAIQAAKLHALETNTSIHYYVGTAEEFAKHPSRFEVITCMELLEHVPNPASILEASAALMKDQGHLILSTLNRTPKAFVHAILGAEYVLKLLPKGTHQYAQFIRPAELCSWARRFGLSLKAVMGLQYKPLQQRFVLSRDVSVNYIAHFMLDKS